MNRRIAVRVGRTMRVIGSSCVGAIAWCPAACLADERPRRLIERLTPMQRSRVVLLLLFIVILGVGTMLFAWLWGRLTLRRIRGGSSGSLGPLDPDDWATRPLNPSGDGFDDDSLNESVRPGD